MFITSMKRLACIALAFLALSSGQQPVTANDVLGLGGMLGGIQGAVGNILGTGVPGVGSVIAPVGSIMNTATNVVSGVTAPLLGPSGIGNMLSSTLGGLGTLTGGEAGLVGNTLRLTQGAMSGITTGFNNGLGTMAQQTNLGSLAQSSVGQQLALASQGRRYKRSLHKRQAALEGYGVSGATNQLANEMISGYGVGPGSYGAGQLAASNYLGAGQFGRQVAAGAVAGLAGPANALSLSSAASAASAAGAPVTASNLATAAGAASATSGSTGFVGSGLGGAGFAAEVGAAGLAGAAQTATNLAGAANLVGSSGLAGATSAALGAATADHLGSSQALMAPASPLVGSRQALTFDAIRNARAESAAAGAEMVADGAVNARSASLASNAYRQAKLASARDRVNIAGTIQNSARISDAAIATHDAATKAEDSLLGSELAVDSASTVLDSDAAYIPPVTSSLLRSLPYGRLGVRNIIPKPLTYPSPYLPDVWLNGWPVNYHNIPLRMLPYGLGPLASHGQYVNGQIALANGPLANGQPFLANNGMVLNSLVFDPAYAYMLNANVNGVVSSSLAPILANGQLEAQDELAMSNFFNMQQMNGVGMASTYQGYGRINPVPMITGSVSDNNLMPTTTIGTTYPIGSALVVEPRDSYFQDYNDNASSRQNFDERQQ